MAKAEGQGELDQFRSWHDEAFLYINQAMTQEKPNIARHDVALLMYQRGLGTLDQALCFDVESGTGPEWDKARKMQAKMTKTRAHVSERIIHLTDILAPLQQNLPLSRPPPPKSGIPPHRPPPPENLPQPNGQGLPSYQSVLNDGRPSAPPSYQESQARMMPYSNVQIALDEIAQLDCDPTELSNSDASKRIKKSSSENIVNVIPAENSIRKSVSNDSVTSGEQGEILFSMADVQVFHVTADGEVTTPSCPTTLHIIKFSNEQCHRGGAPAFIEVGQWTYPLIPEKSPILHASFGGYMFPDLDADCAPGSSVGIVIPDSVTQTDREIFESLLSELTTAFKTQEDVQKEYEEYREFTSTVAVGLVKGAELVGRGMVKGAVKTSEYMFQGADYAKQYITPESPRPVDPSLKQGLEAARWVSSGAVRVSGWMVSKVGSATMALGRLMAPHLQRGANRALTHITKQSETESSNQLAIAGELAAGTVAAVSTVYMALENSSKILAKNIANNTVMIVSHKYGTDMAAVTDAALATAGNSYLAVYNAGALGPKGIAKRTAKDAGKAMVGVEPSEVESRAIKAQNNEEGITELLAITKQKENT